MITNVYCPARGGEAAAADKTPSGSVCRYCGGKNHAPVKEIPCAETEAHAAHLGFFGECSWCGATS